MQRWFTDQRSAGSSRRILAAPATGPTLLADWQADTLGLANNANVLSWPDSTSTQGPFTGTGTAMVYKTAQQNGLSAVAVAASNGAPGTMNTAIPQPLTVLVAMKLNSAGQTGTIIKLGGASNVQVYLTGSGFDMNNGVDLVRWTPDTGFHIFTMHFAGAASYLRVDGVQQGAVGNAGTAGISTGGAADALAGQSGGYLLGEIVIHAGAPVTATETALRTKWGTA